MSQKELLCPPPLPVKWRAYDCGKTRALCVVVARTWHAAREAAIVLLAQRGKRREPGQICVEQAIGGKR